MSVKIIYPIEWNERECWEISLKGWFGNVFVENEKGQRFELTFFDLVRLTQEFDYALEQGKAGFIEQGLIVIPEVTKENIEKAIAQAEKEGFFE